MKPTHVPTRFADEPDPIKEFFSIDADAHLEKLTAHVFPSPVLLPVELVRSALKRNATVVSIRVNPQRLVISDNGSGIEKKEWQALACLGNPGQSAEAREHALALIQSSANPGIGLLAVFLPKWRNIQIENAVDQERSTLRIVPGRSERNDAANWPRGTRITICRRRGPATEEINLLARLCAAVPAEIRINDRPLKKRPLLADNLVMMDLTQGSNLPPGQLAIPTRGDVCRFWLLDQAIPWQVTNSAALQGLVFSVALETLVPPTATMLEALSAHADRLYHWLAENYAGFPQAHQTRIEELFFKHIYCGGNPDLLSCCAPFLFWPSQKRLTLAELQHQAGKGAIHAMDFHCRPSRSSGRKEDVLLLSAAQKVFLIDHLHLPISFMNPRQQNKDLPRSLPASIWNAVSRILARIRPAQAIDVNRLSREEISLCRELESHWRRKILRQDPIASMTPLAVVLIEGRGWAAARWLKTKNCDMLQIRRRHPLTRYAMRVIARSSANGELALAALMPDFFLTGRQQ